MGNQELLEVGADRRGRTSPAQRRLLVLCLLLVLATLAWLDDRAQRAEQRAVERCADDVTAAVDLAGRGVLATYEYVRPALSSGPDSRLRNGLHGLIAEAAAGGEARLSELDSRCEAVTVLPHHRELDRRRDRCLDVLAAQRAELDAVARDGARVMEWFDTPRTC